MPFLNALIEIHNAERSGEPLEPLDPEDATFPRGLAYVQVGKSSDYSSFGARYFVDPEVYDLIALDRYEATGGESEDVMGPEQREWFVRVLSSSDASWKIWGNSYTLTTRNVTLEGVILPEGFNSRFRLSADDWDGFPHRRAELLASLEGIDDVIAVTGDSHSFFASATGVSAASSVLEFVCGAISSATYQSILAAGIEGAEGLQLLAPFAGGLIAAQNPHIAYQNVADNGFAVVEASEAELRVRFFELALGKVLEPSLDGELSEHFARREFRVRRGTGQLEQRLDGEFLRWNAETQSYA